MSDNERHLAVKQVKQASEADVTITAPEEYRIDELLAYVDIDTLLQRELSTATSVDTFFGQYTVIPRMGVAGLKYQLNNSEE